MKRKTTHLKWDEYNRLLDILKGDKFRVLIGLQGMCGLRIGDVLNLKWGDVVGKDCVSIVEEKTGKSRTVYLNKTLIGIINQEYSAQDSHIYIFRSKFSNSPISLEYVNRRLKRIFSENNILYSGNVSSHLFRKSFGRRYMDLNDWSDKALIMLNEVYGHSTIAITKIYLGIKEEEIKSVYNSLV